MMTVKEITERDWLEMVLEQIEYNNEIEKFIIDEILEYCNDIETALNFLQEEAVYWMPYFSQIKEWAIQFQYDIDECFENNFYELGIEAGIGLFEIYYRVLDFYKYEIELKIREKLESYEEEEEM